MSAKRMQRTGTSGPVRLLSVGVDDYDELAGFCPLEVCSSDAAGVQSCFQTVPQLGGQEDHLELLTSRGHPRPSRGQILKQIRRLAQNAAVDDRLIFYYSGHIHRIGSEAYLVPED